jgi:hypothetical protein
MKRFTQGVDLDPTPSLRERISRTDVLVTNAGTRARFLKGSGP